jgi:hypothetical protein
MLDCLYAWKSSSLSTRFPNPQKEPALIFNIHVNNTDVGNHRNPGRVYVNPMGKKVAGGSIKAALSRA